MKRWYSIVIIAFFAAGCVRQVRESAPPPQAIPSVPLNQNVSPEPTAGDAIDANDYLDQALEELDTVENLDVE